MRKLVLGAMIALGAISLQSCDKDDDGKLQVTAELQEAFEAKYPNVSSHVDWTRNGEFYEAGFSESGYENKAWFTTDGVWVMTEYDIRYEQLPEAVKEAFEASQYASWKLDDVDKIEKSDMSTLYVLEIESGELEYELSYLEDGTLIRESTEWDDHVPVSPGNITEVKDLVLEMYPQAKILDIEEDDGGIEVEIRDGRLQKDVFFVRKDGALLWAYTSYEMDDDNWSLIPDAVKQTLRQLVQEGWEIDDDIDYYENASGVFYRVEVEDRNDNEKHIYISETGELAQI